MKRTLYFAVFLSYFLFTGVNARADGISVSVSKRTLRPEESISLTIKVEGSPDQPPTRPVIPGFQYAGGQGTSRQISIINGKMTSSTSYSYEYVPVKGAGKYAIPPVTVTINGKKYSSQTIPVEVITPGSPVRVPPPAAPQGQTAQNKSPKKTPPEIFLREFLEPATAFINQQVTYHLQFYTRVKTNGISIGKPQTVGFEVMDLPHLPQKTVNIKGTNYAMLDSRLAIFPQETGKLTIPPAKINVQVARIVKRNQNNPFASFFNDPFFGGGYRWVPVSYSSKPLKLNVRPMPDNAKKKDFGGLVGQYSIRGRLTRYSVTQGDALSLLVNVKGNGNIRLLVQPEINLPPDIFLHDSDSSETVAPSGGRITGEKNFEYILIPQVPGKFRIPPVAMTFFDPVKKKYVGIHTRPFHLTVTARKGGNSNPMVSVPVQPRMGFKQKTVHRYARDISFIKVEPPDFDTKGHLSLQKYTLASIFIIPPMGWMFLLAWSIRRRKLSAHPELYKRKNALRLAFRQMKKASGETQDIASLRGIFYYAGYRFGKNPSGLTSLEIQDEIQARLGAETSLTAELDKIIQSLEAARYANQEGREDDGKIPSRKDVMNFLKKLDHALKVS